MTPWQDIEERIEAAAGLPQASAAAAELLGAGEKILENWIRVRGGQPDDGHREGFRLLALHWQGCRGEPSFNACRESCRELVYHHNLALAAADPAQARHEVAMMGHVARHLMLFVSGKMQVAGLGEFCCSSKPLHVNSR